MSELIYQTCKKNSVWAQQLLNSITVTHSALVELTLSFSPLAISLGEQSWLTVAMDINKIKLGHEWETKDKHFCLLDYE